MIYYLLIFTLFVLGILEIYVSKKERVILYGVALIILWVFAGFKEEGGTDFDNYHEIFFSLNTHTFTTTTIEPLFGLFILLIKFIYPSFVLYWALLTAFNLSIKFYIFKKYTPYLFPALLIYFVGMFIERDFDGIRQGLAMGICLLSLKYVIKNRFLPFIALVIIATFIHTSSIIFCLIYFIRNIHIKNQWLYCIIGLSLLFAILNLSISHMLLYFIPESIVRVKLMNYAESETYAASAGINIGTIFRIIILILFTSTHNKLKIDKKLYNVLKNGFALSVILSLVFHDFMVLSHRLPYVFREFQILIIPYTYYLVKGNKNKVLILCIIFCYALTLMMRILQGELGFYYEYQNLIFS